MKTPNDFPIAMSVNMEHEPGSLSSLTRFKRVHKAQKRCETNINNYFITRHVSTTKIIVEKVGDETDAVLLFNYKEGADDIVVYTYINENLEIGDYFIWKDKYFILYEEIYIAREIGFKKWKAVECNAVANGNVPVAYFGPMRAHKSDVLYKIYNASGVKSIIIVPKGKFALGDMIEIQDMTWEIVGGDLVSVSNINYLYLDQRLGAENVDTSSEDDLPANTVYSGSVIFVECDNGLFQSNVEVETVARNGEGSYITVPFGITSLMLNVKVEGVPTVIEYNVRSH